MRAGVDQDGMCDVFDIVIERAPAPAVKEAWAASGGATSGGAASGGAASGGAASGGAASGGNVQRPIARPARLLPADPAARKEYPIGTGVLDYFPDALAAVANVSFHGNRQHNPGQPLHWSRGKSSDQSDTILRHFVERGTLDSDGLRHSAKLAWRALALLQEELEQELKLSLPRGARV